MENINIEYVEYLINEFNTCSLEKLEKYNSDYESGDVSSDFKLAYETWLSKK